MIIWRYILAYSFRPTIVACDAVRTNKKVCGDDGSLRMTAGARVRTFDSLSFCLWRSFWIFSLAMFSALSAFSSYQMQFGMGLMEGQR